MIERPENPKIIYFNTLVLSLYVQKHGIWTVIEEREIKKNGDDLPLLHSWRSVQEYCFHFFKRDSQKKEMLQTSTPQNYLKE